MSHKYSLDKSSKKFLCPACEKRRFVKYANNETGEYLNDEVGRCDREGKCEHHFAPKAYFKSIGSTGYKDGNYSDYKTKIRPKPKLKKSDRISIEDVKLTLDHDEQNDFTLFLDAIFGEDLTNHLISKFFLGTYKKWGRGATVFWQVDKEGKIRSGKIMAYDPDTGSRIKGNDKPLITWYHSEKKWSGMIDSFQLEQCLFGVHQLNTEPADKRIAIVESEKTAIIMTALMPEIIWMATGGLSQIKKEIFMPLFGREITLFPDLNGFEKWKGKMEVLEEIGFDISINDYLEKNANEEDKKEGYDLVDFFLKRCPFFYWALTEKKYPLFWDR